MMQRQNHVRNLEEIRAVLRKHKQTLRELAQRLEADERGTIFFHTPEEKEEAWSDRDILRVEVATLEWILLESDAPPYPVQEGE